MGEICEKCDERPDRRTEGGCRELGRTGHDRVVCGSIRVSPTYHLLENDGYSESSCRMNALEANGKTFPMKDRGNNGNHYLSGYVMMGRAKKQSSLWKIVLQDPTQQLERSLT